MSPRATADTAPGSGDSGPDPDPEEDSPRPGAARRVITAFSSPNSYGLVLLLIAITYIVSTGVTASRAASLVIAIQIATVWVALRASQARHSTRVLANVVLAITAVVAVLNLFWAENDAKDGAIAAVSVLLYFIAPLSVIRHLILRRVTDLQTVLGAIAAYLFVGMFFAFLYHATGQIQSAPLFGQQGDGTLPQDLFFSFTTLTTTGYGDLVPARNPGQTMAVVEMLVGQLFLVAALGKVISNWQPSLTGRGAGLRAESGRARTDPHADDAPA
jgi:Ion channel